MLTIFGGDFATRDTFRYIEEKLGIGLWTWDVETNAMEWSRGVYALFGLSEDVMPSYDLLVEMMHPDDRRKPGEMERIVAGSLPIEREFRILWKNGRVRWVQSRGDILMGPNGRAKRGVGVMRDVTARRETQQTLHANTARLDGLTQAVGAPVWTAKMDGRITSIKNWADIRDDDPEDALGDAWIQFVHPDDRAATVAAWDGARARRAIYEVEHRVRQPDGSYRWGLSRAVPVRADGGRVEEYVGITYDIQDRKTLLLMDEPEQKLTGAQIRAARGILNWSVKELADNTGVSAATIRRLEETDGATGDEVLAPIARALLKAGASFYAAPTGKPAAGPR